MDFNSKFAYVHNEVISAIRNSSAVSSITNNVYDGFPTQLLRYKGYPMVVVSSPTSADSPATLSSKRLFLSSIVVPIFIFATKQSTARQLADAVGSAIAGHSFASLSFNGFGRSTENVRIIDDSGRKEWQINLYPRFEADGKWQ